ncbi:MAG TPA: TPM domain-containing protein [Myxococcus sp.]|nr:TPM domain-containing protein [Myxococcus sp.]
MVRLWALLLLLPALALGATPSIMGPVTDTRALLSIQDSEALTEELINLRRSTGAQMAVLIVGSTEGEPIEDYALRVAEKWGGGAKKQEDGLLLVIAVDDRRMRLDVGYGLEEHLPDDAVRTLLDAQGPRMRQQDYRGAVLGVLAGVRARVPGADGVVSYVPAWNPKELGSALTMLLFLGLIAGVVVGLGMGDFREHTGRLGPGGVAAALLLGPMPFIAFAVRNSQLPTTHFLLAHAMFATVFCLGILAWERVSWKPGVALIGGTLVGSGGALADTKGHDVLTLLMEAGRASALLSVSFFVIIAVKGRSGSTYSSSSSSSSSWGSSSSGGSSTSWSGGGGSFGGGGASSSW